MGVERRTVEELAEPPGYAHVAVARRAMLVFTAGAVPLDEHGKLVGADDAEMQTEQVIANLLRQLDAGGATPDDVVKTTVYVAGASHETQARVWKNVTIVTTLRESFTIEVARQGEGTCIVQRRGSGPCNSRRGSHEPAWTPGRRCSAPTWRKASSRPSSTRSKRSRSRRPTTSGSR